VLASFIGIGFVIINILDSTAFILIIGVIWLAFSVIFYMKWIQLPLNFYVAFAIVCVSIE
jgi:hypothetical protein